MKSTASKTPAAPETPRKSKRWSVVVGIPKSATPQADTGQDFIPLEKLEQAERLRPTPLPHRPHLETLFQQDLSWVRSHTSHAADTALDASNAVAAVVGDVIFLRANAKPDTVAHEVAHILQKRGTRPADPAAAETEARQVEQQAGENRLIGPIIAGLPDHAVALRARDDLDNTTIITPTHPKFAFNDATNDPAPISEPESPAPQSETTADSAELETDIGADIPEPTPTFELAPMPEIEVDTDAAAARAAQANTALDTAQDADSFMTALKDAPPSVKAARQGGLETETARLVTKEQGAFNTSVPGFEAKMNGDAELAATPPVATPENKAPTLEDAPPGPAPDPVIAPTPALTKAEWNANIRAMLDSLFGFGDANGLGKAFNNVKTSDTQVETSAGARPEIPLEKETDPKRVVEQDEKGRADAKAKRQEATKAVLDGPGPEQAQLKTLSETAAIDPRPVPEIAQAAQTPDGAEEFTGMTLDTEVTALFDQHHHDAMATSLEGAQTEMSTAVSDRNTKRDEKVSDAETETTRLNAKANTDQRTEITDRRQQIQDARQTAVDDQAQHVTDLETEADTARGTAKTDIDEKIRTTDEEINTSFDKAESDAEAKVREGDKKAEDKRAEQKREAENASWWDRAANWVGEQFDKLTKFINDVFDAVRSLVKGIIDVVKKAAKVLIKAAASVIKSAIKKFGDVLKKGINALLADHFPGVARALTSAVDIAVTVANKAVDIVADGLIAGIDAVLDALAAGLDAVLGAFQAAANVALAIARGVLTGDWSDVVKAVLEPILRALGIAPATFYAFFAKAKESLGIIVDDPIGFLVNLLESVKGGIARFAENFLTHLQVGIIKWLTGSLGGAITLPDKWNLWGLLDLARQILGLTTDMFRRVAVRVLGEDAVAKIEFFMNYAVELVKGGWSALWEKIQADLGQLADTVLEQIKTFLVEKVVLAAIKGIAMMFSPVGALLKLVLTIWNFIMFLKDQLKRIFQIVQTVVNTLMEIATGVLEPAKKGVESVLANLLPVAIDLMAKLFDLGNISRPVKKLITNIQKSIEAAITKLIKRVVAKFTGKGGGKKAKGGDSKPGEIMRPVPLRGGGQSHTLTIHDQGETVVPMIRSTPQPLAAWLDARSGAPFTKLAKDNGWDGDTLTANREKLATLVKTAKQEEGLLDKEAEQAEDTVDDASAAKATAKQKAKAKSDTAEVAAQAQDTKTAVEKILDFFGIADKPDLAKLFAHDLARLNTTVADQLRAQVFSRLDGRFSATLTWPELVEKIIVNGKLPAAWMQPAMRRGDGQGGIVQRADWTGYVKGVTAIVTGARGTPQFIGPTAEADLHGFLDRQLTPALNNAAHRKLMLRAVLTGSGGIGGAAASAVRQIIKTEAKAQSAAGLEHDQAFQKVTGSFYKSNLVENLRTELKNGSWGSYFHEDAENAAGAGAGKPQTMGFLLRADSTGKAGSKRASQNRSRLADAVRGADTGQHEWIASRMAATIVETAAKELIAGRAEALIGANEVLQFQHHVRTPTTDLIFKPGGKYPAQEVLTAYKSQEHHDSDTYSDTTMNDLPAAQRDAWYPPSSPKQGEKVGILQGHPGAVYARAKQGDYTPDIKPQSGGHGTWDTDLALEVTRQLADGRTTFREMQEIGDNILLFYKKTIWTGGTRPAGAGGRVFSSYYASGGTPATYGALRSKFKNNFVTVYSQLKTDITKVTGS